MMQASTLFVSHGPAQVSLAAAVVDFLEEAVEATEGQVRCTGVPGYVQAGANSDDHAVVIGLWTGPGDHHVVADLLRALERGRPAILICLHRQDAQGEGAEAPLVHSNVTRLAMDRGGLSVVMEDVAHALRVLPRLTAAGRAALTELLLVVHRLRDADGEVASDAAPVAVDEVSGGESELWEQAEYAVPDSRPPEVRQSGTVPTRTPARAKQCSEVGALLADCLFHEAPLGVAATLPGGLVSSLYEALGGAPPSLEESDDAEHWQQHFDKAFEGMPPERSHYATWYEAGFQLALTCSLADPGAPSDDPDALAEARTETWNAFTVAAHDLRLPSEVIQQIASEISAMMEQSEGQPSVARLGCLRQLHAAAHSYDEAREAARREYQQLQA